jgi:hypothetical protein
LNLEWLGVVSTEGGPLLIADREVVVDWNTVLGDDTDYRRACEPLDRSPQMRGFQLDVAGEAAIVWDIPTGTSDVWRRSPRSVVLSRCWVDRDDESARRSVASLPPVDPLGLGTFKLESGWVVIIWAAESGPDVAKQAPSPALALNLSVGGSGIVVDMPRGDYAVYCDEVTEGSTRSLRAFIVDDREGLFA